MSIDSNTFLEELFQEKNNWKQWNYNDAET